MHCRAAALFRIVAIHVRKDAAEAHKAAADGRPAIVPARKLLGRGIAKKTARDAVFNAQRTEQQDHRQVLLFLVGLEIVAAQITAGIGIARHVNPVIPVGRPLVRSVSSEGIVVRQLKVGTDVGVLDPDRIHVHRFAVPRHILGVHYLDDIHILLALVLAMRGALHHVVGTRKEMLQGPVSLRTVAGVWRIEIVGRPLGAEKIASHTCSTIPGSPARIVAGGEVENDLVLLVARGPVTILHVLGCIQRQTAIVDSKIPLRTEKPDWLGPTYRIAHDPRLDGKSEVPTGRQPVAMDATGTGARNRGLAGLFHAGVPLIILACRRAIVGLFVACIALIVVFTV